MRLDLERRCLELGGKIPVVVGNAPGQVSGARTVDDAVGLEHRVDPLVVRHIELHGALLDRETEDVHPRLEGRDLLLGLGDLVLEVCLLGLGGGDLGGQLGCLVARVVEALLSERERISLGAVVGHDPTRRDRSRRGCEHDERDQGVRASHVHEVRFCRGSAFRGPPSGIDRERGSLERCARTRRSRGGWP